MDFLLMGCQLLFRRRGGALGAAFLFHVHGAIRDFVVDLFNFQSEVEFLGVLGVFFKERVPLGFQVVAFFLPDTCNG